MIWIRARLMTLFWLEGLHECSRSRASSLSTLKERKIQRQSIDPNEAVAYGDTIQSGSSQGAIVCILGALAEDKGTGKAKKSTITLDHDNLSDEDIERMVTETPVYAEEAK